MIPAICLAAAIYYEAGFESQMGQIAVAYVAMHRAHGDRQRLCSVITKPLQFSFTIDHPLDQSFVQPSNTRWLHALDIARSVLAGNAVDIMPESDHYHAQYVKPKWAKHLRKIAQIGEHIFYANVE